MSSPSSPPPLLFSVLLADRLFSFSYFIPPIFTPPPISLVPSPLHMFHMYVCKCVVIYLYVYACVGLHLFVCIYLCMRVCICMNV